MRTKINHLTKVMSCLLLASTTTPIMAKTFNANTPWIKVDIPTTSHGIPWSNTVKLYTRDINGDGNKDIIRQNPGSSYNSIDIFLNQKVNKPGFLPNPNYFNISPYEYKSAEIGFIPLGFSFPDGFTRGHFDGNQVDVIFANISNNRKTDIIRQETGSIASDDILSAQLFSDYTLDNATYGKTGYCTQSTLPSDFNGAKGAKLLVGDFNHDGIDDILRTEFAGYSHDHVKTVNVYYGGHYANDNVCGSPIPTLTKAPNNLLLSSNSDGRSDNPQILFDWDDAGIKIGDFNNDGFSDILRFDLGDTISNQVADKSNHEKAGVWFGLNNKTGEFERSYIYLDANGNGQKESAEGTIANKLKDFSRNQVIIGDYNGDGADDILAYKGRDVTIFLSKAVESYLNPETSQYEANKRKIGLFEEVNLPNVVNFNLNDTNVKVKIADFNNDGRDDILAWNNQPYILYSHTPNSEDSAGKALALTTIKHSNILHNNEIDGSGFTNAGSTKLIEVADFTNDGYPDILAAFTNKADGTIFVTPPYNPLESVRTNYAGNIEHSEGTTYKGNNLVFFNDNGTLKYMARNQFGWQSPKDVPLYLKTSDARCNNDLPENGLFLTANQFDSTTPSYQSDKDYYTQPVCNASYHGEVFDVTADDKYIYLFRAYNDPSDPNHDQTRNNQVLLDRFIYNSAANRLERLTEARYQISEQRYKATANSRISTTNSRGQTFREPAFTVPFISQTKNGTACPIQSVTVSLMKDAVDANRFILASSCLGNEVKFASIRQGSSEPFNTQNFIYNEGGKNIEISGSYINSINFLNSISLDSLVFKTTAPATNDIQTLELSTGQQLVIAMGQGYNQNISEIITRNIVIDKFGNFNNDVLFGGTSGIRSFYAHNPPNTQNLSAPRLNFGSDGLVHLYWRSANGTLVESALNPELTLIENQLYPSWLQNNKTTQLIQKYNWPIYTHNYQNTNWTNYSGRFSQSGQVYAPPFGTYYSDKSRILSNKRSTPVIFEYGGLIEKDGRQKGILKRAFIDSLNINADNSSQKSFVISEQNLTELEAKVIGRYSTNAKVIGFMEGAPPIPRENLGRDQNGRWGYTESAASVDLEFNQGTSITITKDSNVGLGASGLAGYQGFYVSAYLKGDFSTGGSRNYVLSSKKSRSSIATGATPARPCSDSESPYLEACHKTESGELVELWQPFNKGAIWASVLSADLVALTNPETQKTVGYVVDFTSAQENNKIVSFDINPSYQVAGSLDGYIGNVPVPSLTSGSRYKSYFKPLEERQWRITAERQQQELEKRYEQNRGVQNGLEDNSSFVQDSLLVASNTIALGAHQADGTTAAASITDYVGKALEVGAAVGYKTPDGVTDLFGLKYEIEAAGSFKVERRHTKDQTLNNSFNSHINRAISSEIQDEYGNTLPYKVDQYTSRSYFIPASLENYNTLLNDVFDQTRLSNMSLSDQQIIEDLKKSPNKIWRVVHRVDAISRAMPNPFNN